jgi:hypothetical protein
MASLSVCGQNQPILSPSAYLGDGSDKELKITKNDTAYLDSVRAEVTDGVVQNGNYKGITYQNYHKTAYDSFAEGDLVAVVQMTWNGSGKTRRGYFDLQEIETHDPSNNLIVFEGDGIKKSLFLFNPPKSKAQIIEINQYSEVILFENATLTCHKWDGHTGGIAPYATPTIYFESGSKINVQGKGFCNPNSGGEGGSGGQGGLGGSRPPKPKANGKPRTDGNPSRNGEGPKPVGGRIVNDPEGISGGCGGRGGHGYPGDSGKLGDKAEDYRIRDIDSLFYQVPIGTAGDGGQGGHGGEGGGGGGSGGNSLFRGKPGEDGSKGQKGGTGGDGGCGAGGILALVGDIYLVGDTSSPAGAFFAKGAAGERGESGGKGGAAGDGGNGGKPTCYKDTFYASGGGGGYGSRGDGRKGADGGMPGTGGRIYISDDTASVEFVSNDSSIKRFVNNNQGDIVAGGPPGGFPQDVARKGDISVIHQPLCLDSNVVLNCPDSIGYKIARTRDSLWFPGVQYPTPQEFIQRAKITRRSAKFCSGSKSTPPKFAFTHCSCVEAYKMLSKVDSAQVKSNKTVIFYEQNLERDNSKVRCKYCSNTLFPSLTCVELERVKSGYNLLKARKCNLWPKKDCDCLFGNMGTYLQRRGKSNDNPFEQITWKSGNPVIDYRVAKLTNYYNSYANSSYSILKNSPANSLKCENLYMDRCKNSVPPDTPDSGGGSSGGGGGIPPTPDPDKKCPGCCPIHDNCYDTSERVKSPLSYEEDCYDDNPDNYDNLADKMWAVAQDSCPDLASNYSQKKYREKCCGCPVPSRSLYDCPRAGDFGDSSKTNPDPDPDPIIPRIKDSGGSQSTTPCQAKLQAFFDSLNNIDSAKMEDGLLEVQLPGGFEELNEEYPSVPKVPDNCYCGQETQFTISYNAFVSYSTAKQKLEVDKNPFEEPKLEENTSIKLCRNNENSNCKERIQEKVNNFLKKLERKCEADPEFCSYEVPDVFAEPPEGMEPLEANINECFCDSFSVKQREINLEKRSHKLKMIKINGRYYWQKKDRHGNDIGNPMPLCG